MSEIVLGLATSHSPLLTFDVDNWIEKAVTDTKRKLNMSDGRMISYEALKAERGEPYEAETQKAYLEEQRRNCQASLDKLADALEEAAPDVVVVIGDDHAELFSLANMPAVSIFYGDTLLTLPFGEVQEHIPGWKQAALAAYAMDTVHEYPGAPELAMAAMEGLIQRHIDVGAAAEVKDPRVAGFGHAYGFVAERLFRGRSYPMLPVLLNTYFPPNVPTSARCYDIGKALREVLEGVGDQRIAVVASGGLSHFVTDAELDLGVLNAMKAGDVAHLRSVPPGALMSGSSEILNWIFAAGMLDKLKVQTADYYPVYRTLAGTGVGMGFAIWR